VFISDAFRTWGGLCLKQYVAKINIITPVVSLSQDRKGSKPLYNHVIGGKVFISTSTSAKNIEHVKFWLNDTFGEGKTFNIDRWPPFDLLGRKHKRHNMRPMAFDTTRRENGEHSILIEFLFTDETSARMLTPFTIFNEANIPFSEQYNQQRFRSHR